MELGEDDKTAPASRKRPPPLADYLVGGGFLLAAVVAGTIWIQSNFAGSPFARPDVMDTASAGFLNAGKTAPATELTRRTLALKPDDAAAWCRLAAARDRQVHQADDEVQSLLLKSYQAAPIDIDAFGWRSAYIFSHWSLINPDLRRFAAQEVRALDRIWEARPAVDKALANIHDPAGHFAFRLLRARL